MQGERVAVNGAVLGQAPLLLMQELMHRCRAGPCPLGGSLQPGKNTVCSSATIQVWGTCAPQNAGLPG